MIINTVKFDLSLPTDMLELPYKLMVARGYSRNEVMECFKELEALGYGKLEAGQQGRGHCCKFVPNDNCPKEFSLDIVKKSKGRPKKSESQKITNQ